MSKSIRVRTTPGDDSEKYIKVKLKQDYDFLEILSLKLEQTDEYKSFCSDYGVIAGRVIINGGFGVPNTKVSIFVPIDSNDVDNELIKKIYPYETPNTDEKNAGGVRYNLLPNTQQTLDHTPVGSFPTKREVLDNNVSYEIYEKYYKYTTTTNESGDFILFGVPVGRHTLHYDMDLSDIGFLSTRPYELIENGYKPEDFQDKFTFKASSDIDDLPQIVSGNIGVDIEPYWCDDLATGRIIGINRQDISIESVEITPNAIFFGSILSDDEKDSINKNCRPRRNLGKMDDVTTGGGKLEAIRRTIDGKIEKYNLKNSEIDDNGNWSVLIPMNMRKVVTNEFGKLVPSNDPNIGVATESDIRFRVSMDATTNDKRLRQRASFLVPNMTNNFAFGEYTKSDLKTTDDFKINEQLSTITVGTPYQDELFNQYNYLEEFYTFRWKKVYTVKQYIGRYQSARQDETRSFTGIKDIMSGLGVNKFPTNRMDTNVNPLYSIVCFLLSIFGILVGIINSVINQINGLITAICQVKIPCGITSQSYKSPRTRIDWEIKKSKNGGGGWKNATDWESNQSDFIDFDLLSNGDWDPGSNISNNECGEYLVGVNGWKAVGGKLLQNSPISTSVGTLYQFNQQTDNSPFSMGNGSGSFTMNARYPKNNVPGNSGRFLCPGTHTVGPIGGGSSPTSAGDSKWCYSHIDCASASPPEDDSNGNRCKRWKYKTGVLGTNNNSLNNCQKKVNQDLKNNCDGLKLLGRCWKLKYKCIFANLFCRRCNSLCPTGVGDQFSCSEPGWTNPGTTCSCDNNSDNVRRDSDNRIKKCRSNNCPENETGSNKRTWCRIDKDDRVSGNGPVLGKCDPIKTGCGRTGKCCENCCGKVPLIRLGCDEDTSFDPIQPIILIPTIFGGLVCNQTLIIPYGCASCGGLETAFVKDWVACKLEGLASALNMLKFDFYNDWVNGTLYFPLIKRKYKVKSSKRKFGNLKKDKFCDFRCDDFQGNKYENRYRVKIKNSGPRFDMEKEVTGQAGEFCQVKDLKRSFKYTTNWYGGFSETLGTYLTEDQALDLATKEIVFNGTLKSDEQVGCQISFENWQDYITWSSNYGDLKHKVRNRRVQTEHRKPKYVKTTDPVTGLETWENIGGHGHHQNKCNTVFLHEKEEYFKPLLDCGAMNDNSAPPTGFTPTFTSGPVNFEGDEDDEDDNDADLDSILNNSECPREDFCDTACGNDGVAGCTTFCRGPQSQCQNDDYNKKDIRHGVVDLYDDVLYYAALMNKQDPNFNNVEYKANLLFPTNITELGSSTFCDIDEAPFIMDKLSPTTFQVSEDTIRVRTKPKELAVSQPNQGDFNDDNTIDGNDTGLDYEKIEIKAYKELRNSKINLRAYVEFSCFAAKCININGGLIQSQVGVDIIDSNNLDLQTKSCFLRFDHDEEVREYFCKRFSGFKDNDLNVNYMRPGSTQFENTYKTYPEIKVVDSAQYPWFYVTTEDEYIRSEYNDGDSFIPGDRCGITTRNAQGITTNVDNFYGVAPGQVSQLINFPNNPTTITNANANVQDAIDNEGDNGIQKGIRHYRSQTPYYFYFGLIPGKSALHKVVANFFADKINKITLKGIGAGNPASNRNNQPPAADTPKTTNQVYRTCLGDTRLELTPQNPNTQ